MVKSASPRYISAANPVYREERSTHCLLVFKGYVYPKMGNSTLKCHFSRKWQHWFTRKFLGASYVRTNPCVAVHPNFCICHPTSRDPRRDGQAIGRYKFISVCPWKRCTPLKGSNLQSFFAETHRRWFCWNHFAIICQAFLDHRRKQYTSKACAPRSPTRRVLEDGNHTEWSSIEKYQHRLLSRRVVLSFTKTRP